VTRLTRLRAWCLCAALVGGSLSCGGSPSAPTVTIVDISGPWTGTWTYTAGGATVTDTVSVTFNQNNASVQGPWSASTGPGGQLILTEGAGLVGTVTISQILLNGTTCSSQTSVTGTATTSRVQLSFGTFATGGLCQWGTNQKFDLTR